MPQFNKFLTSSLINGKLLPFHLCCKILPRKAIMSTIQEQISLDEQAVNEAQAKLDEAIAKLNADRERLAAVAPHLSVLDQIDAELTTIEDGARTRITALTAQLRALFAQ